MPSQLEGVGEPLDVDSYLGHHVVALVHGLVQRLHPFYNLLVVDVVLVGGFLLSTF